MKITPLYFWISIIFIALFVGCSNSTNPVEEYLKNAELQCESDMQRQNLAISLNDALTLPERELDVKNIKTTRELKVNGI